MKTSTAVAALGVLAAAAVLSSPSTATARGGTNESGSPLDPRAYAAGKRSMLLARYDRDELARAVARWGPELWPGTPRSAIVGASASSDGMQGGEHTSYPVVGWLSIERSALARMAASSSERARFGRAIPAAPVGAPSTWYRDAEAQTYAGLRRLRDALDAVNEMIPASLRGTPGDAWALRLGLAGYSVGPGTIAPLVRAYAADLARVDSRDRWATLAERVAQACAGASRVAGVECRGLWHAAHAMLRIDQRLASGELVAGAREPDAVSWYDRLISAPTVGALTSMV